MSNKKVPSTPTRFYLNMKSMVNNVKDKIENPIIKTMLEVGIETLEDRKDLLVDDFVSVSSPEIWRKILQKDEEYLIEFISKMLDKFNIPVQKNMVSDIFSKDKELFWKYIHSFVRIAIHHLHEKGLRQIAEPLAKEWNIKL